MNLISKLLSKLQPNRSVATDKQRKYAAAQINRLSSDWATSILSADSELYSDLRILRARSRELCINNDYARRFLKCTSTNVIGAGGIRLQVRAKDEAGNFIRDVNAEIEEQFELWTRAANCSVDGMLSWVDCQKLFVESIARDGEVIVRFIRKTIDGCSNNFNFALQFLEADHLDEDLNKTLSGGAYIRMGIEFDRFNRRVAYHLLDKHPGELTRNGNLHNNSWNYGNNKKYIRVPASDIIHGFLVDRPSQNRGVPWMHSAMSRLRMLGAYEEAELVAARVGAAKMGFFVSPDGAGYSGIDNDGGAPVMEADPGTFEQLPSGMDVKLFDPNHPNNNFAAFEKTILRGIASGLNISYTTMANDLENVNFSSIRHGSLEDRDNWKVLQNWVIEHFCRPVFEQWLIMAITSGRLNLPISEFDKFNKPVWRSRGWAWVDPLKENHANQIAIRCNTKTRNQIAADQGMDIEEIFSQLAFEEELAKEYGINLEVNQQQADIAKKEEEEVISDDDSS